MKKRILIIVLVIGFIKAEAQTSAFKSIDSLVAIGRYKKALINLKNMPTTFQSEVKTAEIFSSIDNYKKAAYHYEKALLLKDDYKIKVKLGKSYHKQKKRHKAISIFKNIIEKDSGNLLIKYQLGKLYIQTKQPAKAKMIFKELIASDKKNANYYYQLGAAYAMLKKRNPKIDNFLKAYKNDNEHIKSIHQLALAYTFLRDKDSASIFINKGLKLSPNHIAINKLKINNLYRNKEYLKAINLLEKIDSIEPNKHYTQKMLGRTHYKLKDYDVAEKHFKKALQIDRSDFKSYEYLGHINLEKKNYNKSEFNYMMSIFMGREPRDVGYYGMATVNLKDKDHKKAIEFFKKSLEENGKNYRALYQLANTTENFYKDKRIAYKHYKNYIDRFERKDSLLTSGVKTRLKEIKKYYFLKGEILE